MLRGTVEALGDANDRLTIEISGLRQDNLKAHQMACAAGLERDRLRDELAALRKGLDDAANSLCTISQQAGRTEELSEMSQIRGYAFSRYSAALDAARKEGGAT
jgi:hypothetical protein